MNTPTAESTMRGDSQLVGSSEGEVSCSGTPDTRLGGANSLLVTSQTTLPLQLNHPRKKVNLANTQKS